jgi:hypothetical protein
MSTLLHFFLNKSNTGSIVYIKNKQPHVVWSRAVVVHFVFLSKPKKIGFKLLNDEQVLFITRVFSSWLANVVV